jgi:hypothetical protein
VKSALIEKRFLSVVVQLEEESNRMDRIDRIKAEVLLFLYPVHPVHPVNSFLPFKLNHYLFVLTFSFYLFN